MHFYRTANCFVSQNEIYRLGHETNQLTKCKFRTEEFNTRNSE